MKEIKEELEKSLEKLLYEETSEVYIKAVKSIAFSAIKEIDRRVENSSSLTSMSKEVTLNKVVNDISNDKIGFLRWMNENNKGLYDKCEKEVQEENPERTDMIFSLEAFLDFLDLEKADVFLEFDQLAKIFKYIKFDTNYQMRLLFRILKNNSEIDGSLDTNVFVPDVHQLLDFDYDHITRDEIIEILRNNQLEDYFKDTRPENMDARSELLKRFNETKKDYTQYKNACCHLYRIFSSKTSDLDENAYQEIFIYMNMISFRHLANRIIKFLKKNNKLDKTLYEILENIGNINSSDMPVEKKSDDKKVETKEKKDEITVPKKQTSLNQTLREIGTYYDIDDKKIKETLSMDKIIYVLSLMYSINMEKDSIDAFLRSAMREFKNMHPYAMYNQAYDKFAFLGKNDAEIREHLEMIEYILSDTSIFMCDEEEYTETKRLVEEELSEIMRLSKGNFAYEEESAKKLCKE